MTIHNPFETMTNNYLLVDKVFTPKSCSICGTEIIVGHLKYCPDCGQKLFLCDECFSRVESCSCGGALIDKNKKFMESNKPVEKELCPEIQEYFDIDINYDNLFEDGPGEDLEDEDDDVSEEQYDESVEAEPEDEANDLRRHIVF